MKSRLHFFISTLMGLFLGVSIIFGVGYFRVSSASQGYQYLDIFTKVLHFVQSNYVEPVNTEKLMEGAIKGMLSTLDPHTTYLPPQQFKDMQVDTKGEFGGLGIEITIQDGILTVVTPIEDTPAFNAGVQPQDKIVRIVDKKKKIDKYTKNLSLHEAVKIMRGKRKHPVTIHVVREGSLKPIPITVVRDIIKVQSVKSGMIEPEFGWVRITNFQSHTTKDLKKAIKKLQKTVSKNKDKDKRKLKGLILDLRRNPGGLLEEAISVSGTFLGKLPIVSTIGRNKQKKHIEYSKEGSPFKDFKMVVLVDEASASASEIVAGALQDHHRALILGKPTFGKGSVQTVIDLENKTGKKAGLKLTIARYYTPSGRSIQSKGIEPDIIVDNIDPEAVLKARKARVLREADLDGHIKGENEKNSSSKNDGSVVTNKDGRVLKEKDGRKIRITDPKEMVKKDFQLQQALSFLKNWDVFKKFN